MKIKINFNQSVKVKLKDLGINILQEKHYETQMAIHPHDISKRRSFELKIDDDGYTSFQIWELMNIFGSYMNIGLESPFHGDLFFEEFTNVLE